MAYPTVYRRGRNIVIRQRHCFDPQIVEKLLHSDKDDILALNRHELGAEEIKVIVDDAQRLLKSAKSVLYPMLSESLSVSKRCQLNTPKLYSENWTL